MSKKIEITFLKETKLNSQIVLAGHVLKIEENLAKIYVKQNKAILGSKNTIEVYKNGKKLKLDTTKVKGRDEVLAKKELDKKKADADKVAKYNKENARENNPNHLEEGKKKTASITDEEAKAINLGVMSVGELKALALKLGVLVNSQAKEKGCIKALLEFNKNFTNEPKKA